MTIIHADVLKWAATYDGPKFHAMLTDPPYHLTSIVERFGKQGAAPAQHGTDGAYARASRGFMNAQWDGGDIAFRPETWAALAEHLYPGAWGMAFAGSRGWHRMAVAIEDAGLIMQPTIFGWGYGSGFPKATNIAAQIDDMAFREWLALHPDELARLATARAEAKRLKALGATHKAEALAAHKHATQIRREIKALAGFAKVIGTKKHQPKFAAAELGYREKDNGYNSRDRETFDILDCATEAARDWLGHRYGGQAMKPALEPIIVFQKPYQGRPIDNITATGAGALWIDGGRIASDDDTARNPSKGGVTPARFGFSEGGMAGGGHDAGRWPANLVLSHAPDCNGVCADGCPVRRLGEQSGESTSTDTPRNRVAPKFSGHVYSASSTPNSDKSGPADTGTAARFFYQSDYMAERLELADAIAYVAKSSRAEREAGLDPRQTAIMRLLDDDGDDFDEHTPVAGQMVYSGKRYKLLRCPEHDGTIPSGKNNYSCGCRFAFHSSNFSETTVDDGRAIPIDNAYQRGETTRRNTHPTIKPLSLCKYLATLLLPPAAYAPRRLLVPFSGAASEVIGAELAGWEDVTGIELGEDHVAIANARIAYWRQMKHKITEASTAVATKATPPTPKGQLDMFMESEAA